MMKTAHLPFFKNAVYTALFVCLAIVTKESKAQCSIKAMSSDSVLVCGGTTTLSLHADWQQVSTIPMQKLYGMSSPQKDIQFIGADSGKVYKTTNGGLSFTQLNNPNTQGKIKDLWFFNQQNGLLFTDSAKIFKTDNGGNTWQEISYPLTVPDSNYIYTWRWFNTVSFATANIGFAGGTIYSPSGIQAGILYKTTNAGNTWSPLSIPNLKAVEKIYFIDSLHGFIGTYGNMYKTTNGGISWTNIYEMQYLSFSDFTFINKDTGIVETNGLMRTFDGGTTWTVLNTPELFSRGIGKDQNNAIYVMYNSIIYKSVNLGNSWVKLNINPPLSQYGNYLQDIDFSHGNAGLAIGLNHNTGGGFVLKLDKIDSVLWLRDNGLTDTTNLNPIVNPNMSTTYFATAYMGACSTNVDVTVLVEPIQIQLKESHLVSCGDTLQFNPAFNFNQPNAYQFQWLPSQYLNQANSQNPIAFIKQNTRYKLTVSSNNGCVDTATTMAQLNFSIKATANLALACGKEKQLLVQTNGWTKQAANINTVATDLLRDIVAANADTLYLLGNRKIWQSNKEGKTWRIVYNGTNWVTKAHFRNSKLGFVSSFDPGPMQGAILKTSNGGETWQSSNLGNFQLYGIHFTSDQNGFVVASSGKVFKTTNGGNSWIATNTGTTHTLYNISFPSSQIGFAVGSAGTILKTNNAGLTWSNLNAPITSELKAIYFTSVDTGFVGGTDTIWKTFNGGANWTPFVLDNSWQQTFIVNDLKFTDAQNGFAAIEYSQITPTFTGGAIFETHNGGQTWNRMIADSSERLIALVAKTIENCLAIGGYNQILYRNPEPQNFQWNPALGINNVFLKEPIAKPLTTTTYTVTASINDCFVKDSLKVEVLPFLKPANKNIQIVCGDSFTFSNPNLFIGIDAAKQYLSYWEILNEQGIQVMRSNSDSMFTGNYYLSPGNYTFKWHRTGPSMYNIIRIIPFVGDSVSDEFYYTSDTLRIYHFSVGSTQNYTYLWSPAQTIINPNTPVKSYGLVVTSPEGCQGIDSITIIPKTFRIKINGYNYGAVYGPLPCGTGWQLDSTLTNYTGKSGLTYQWSDPKTIEDTNSLYPKVYPNKSGFISLKAQTPNGCIASDSVQFMVEPMFLRAIDTSVSCKTSFRPSIVYQYAGNKALEAMWEPKLELDSATLLQPIFTPSANRNYVLKVNSWNGCTATDTFQVTLRPANGPSLCLVGVGPDNKNQIIWNKSQSVQTEKFYVFKETNITDQYNFLAELNANSEFIVIDSNSNPLVQSNKYRLSKIDVCGIQSDWGTPHKTMHLTINKGAGNTWNLIWNKYEGISVSTYNIYRGSTAANIQLIGTSSGSNNSYTDQNAPEGDVYYQVEIVIQNPCSPSKTYNSSRSNIMSNKFLSLSKEDELKHVLVYPNPSTDKLTVSFDNKNSSYRLQLYSMMGQILIDQETNEPEAHLSVEAIAPGTYVLMISNANGKTERLVVKH